MERENSQNDDNDITNGTKIFPKKERSEEIQKKKRSSLSLEGGKKPFLYILEGL